MAKGGNFRPSASVWEGQSLGSGILYFIRSGTTTHRVLIKLMDVSLGDQASVSLCQCLLRLILQ